MGKELIDCTNFYSVFCFVSLLVAQGVQATRAGHRLLRHPAPPSGVEEALSRNVTSLKC